MPIATMTTKGQVTIPKEVRDHLRLGAGDRLEFVVDEQGGVSLKPASRPARDLFAYLKREGRTVESLAAVDDAIAEVVADDDERIRRSD